MNSSKDPSGSTDSINNKLGESSPRNEKKAELQDFIVEVQHEYGEKGNCVRIAKATAYILTHPIKASDLSANFNREFNQASDMESFGKDYVAKNFDDWEKLSQFMQQSPANAVYMASNEDHSFLLCKAGENKILMIDADQPLVLADITDIDNFANVIHDDGDGLFYDDETNTLKLSEAPGKLLYDFESIMSDVAFVYARPVEASLESDSEYSSSDDEDNSDQEDLESNHRAKPKL
jgi:hypothetical protein